MRGVVRKLGKCGENFANNMLPITSLAAGSLNRRGSSRLHRIELIFYCIISGNCCGLHILTLLRPPIPIHSLRIPPLVLSRRSTWLDFQDRFYLGLRVPVPTYLPSPLCEFDSAGESKESARNNSIEGYIPHSSSFWSYIYNVGT